MPYRTIRIEVPAPLSLQDIGRSHNLYYKGELVPSEVKGLSYQEEGMTHTAVIEGVTVFHRYVRKRFGFFEISSDGKEKPLRPEMLQYIECR